MRRPTRREFLEDCLLAAASVPALSAAALPQAASPGPNELLRVAVVGVRGRGRDHVAGYLSQKDAQVAAVVDVDQNVIGPVMKSIEEKTGKKPQFYQDLRKCLEDKSIDAVSIATCNHTHALLSIWAMQAGKHVYVEKPVSHNVWEGRRTVEAARKYNRVCQSGTQSRSFKGFQEAIRFLHEGKLGKIKVARGLCYNPRPSIGHKEDAPVPPGIDYNLWLGPAPERPWNANRYYYNWHWFWDTGNGDLGNQGIHQMDLARWGMNLSGLPKKVVSVGGRFGYQDDAETANSQLVALDYGDDRQILFEVRGLETAPYRGAKVGVIFHGTQGYMVLSRSEATVFDRQGEALQKFTGTGDHFRNFLDAAKSGKPSDLAADIEEGHLSSALCHLGNISHRLGALQAMYKAQPFRDNEEADETFLRFKDHMNENGVKPDLTQLTVGKILTVDPKTETFAGDPEADKLLTRDYRKPFVVPDKV